MGTNSRQAGFFLPLKSYLVLGLFNSAISRRNENHGDRNYRELEFVLLKFPVGLSF
jgi:hypothetical protein